MEVEKIRNKFPNKIPIIVERHKKESFLPFLEKTKYFVPYDMTLSQFVATLRNHLSIGSSHALYVMAAEKHLPALSSTLIEVYTNHVDEDGFLYISYASEDLFG